MRGIGRKLRRLEKLDERARRQRRETIVRGQQTAVLAWRGGLGILWLAWRLLRGLVRALRWAARTVTAKPTGFNRRRR